MFQKDFHKKFLKREHCFSIVKGEVPSSGTSVCLATSSMMFAGLCVCVCLCVSVGCLCVCLCMRASMCVPLWGVSVCVYT